MIKYIKSIKLHKLKCFCTFHIGNFMKVLSSTEVRNNFNAVLSVINV